MKRKGKGEEGFPAKRSADCKAARCLAFPQPAGGYNQPLVIIADALKKVINSHSAPSFLGRYGGDEFILILHPDRVDEADQLIGEIRGEVARHDTPYPLSLSAGYDELADGGDTIQSCIQRADKKLYMDKGRKNTRSRR